MSISPLGQVPKSPERIPADVATPQPVARASAAAVDSAYPVDKAPAAPSRQQLDDAVSNINKSLQTMSQDLEFSVDEDSQRTIVKVVDQQTKEVIRQMPSPEALEIAKALDKVKGMLIKQTA